MAKHDKKDSKTKAAQKEARLLEVLQSDLYRETRTTYNKSYAAFYREYGEALDKVESEIVEPARQDLNTALAALRKEDLNGDELKEAEARLQAAHDIAVSEASWLRMEAVVSRLDAGMYGPILDDARETITNLLVPFFSKEVIQALIQYY